jgi:flagellar hook-associated protein 1
MGGMGSLYIGASGLQTSQNALNTTAHNLANIGTEGYVRQQVVQADMFYNTLKVGEVTSQQVGIGSSLAQVRQVRDVFLDQSYRLETGRSNFYDVGYGTYYEIESILGTLGGAEFSDSLDGLNNAFNELSKDPSDTASQTILKQKASTFIEDAKNVYASLKEYQYNLNDQVIDTIDQVNSLANTIYELNQKISAIELGGVENANDLRDVRNSALDELAGLIKINYKEDMNSIVTVRAENIPLVGEVSVYEMGYTTDVNTGFVTPTWPDYKNIEVYDMTAEISTTMDTDVGKLKALVLQRGTETTSYTAIPVKEDYQDSSGNWLAGGELAYTAATDYYNDNILLSGMMNTLAEFDQLIHGVVTAVNDILAPNTTMTVLVGEDWEDASGNKLIVGDSYKCLDIINCGKSADGTMGTELFSRSGLERYTEYNYIDGGGVKHTAYVYNIENTSNRNTMYTTENLQVNTAITDSVEKLPVYTSNGSVDIAKGIALLEVWSKGFATLNPNSTAKATYQDYYSKLVVEVGNMASVYKNISISEATTVAGLDDDRQMVIGVSSDEELSNMIRFQNAYNAASRYINVVSEMLEHIVTALGNA